MTPIAGRIARILLLSLPTLALGEGRAMSEASKDLREVSSALRRSATAPPGPWCAGTDAASIRQLRTEVESLDSMASRFHHHIEADQTSDVETRRVLERMNRSVELIRDHLVNFPSTSGLDGHYQRASHLLRRLNRSYYREPDVFRQQPGGRWLDHPLDQARLSDPGFGRFPGDLSGCPRCGRLGSCGHRGSLAAIPPPPTPPANTFLDPGIQQIEYRQDGSIRVSGGVPLAPLGESLEAQRARRERFERLFPD